MKRERATKQHPRVALITRSVHRSARKIQKTWRRCAARKVSNAICPFNQDVVEKKNAFFLYDESVVYAFDADQMLTYIQNCEVATCPFTRRVLLIPEIRRLHNQLGCRFDVSAFHRQQQHLKRQRMNRSIFEYLSDEYSRLCNAHHDMSMVVQTVQDMLNVDVEMCVNFFLQTLSAVPVQDIHLRMSTMVINALMTAR